MKHTISTKKCKHHESSSYSDDPSSSQDDLLGSTRNVRKRRNSNKQKIVNYPSNTTPRAKRGQFYGTWRLRMMEQLLLVNLYDEAVQYVYMNMTSLE